MLYLVAGVYITLLALEGAASVKDGIMDKCCICDNVEEAEALLLCWADVNSEFHASSVLTATTGDNSQTATQEQQIFCCLDGALLGGNVEIVLHLLKLNNACDIWGNSRISYGRDRT